MHLVFCVNGVERAPNITDYATPFFVLSVFVKDFVAIDRELAQRGGGGGGGRGGRGGGIIIVEIFLDRKNEEEEKEEEIGTKSRERAAR